MVANLVEPPRIRFLSIIFAAGVFQKMESDLECDPSSPADADDGLAESDDENGGEPTSDVERPIQSSDCESSDIVRVQNEYYTA